MTDWGRHIPENDDVAAVARRDIGSIVVGQC
jgi:hypothetical protein